MTIFWSRWLCVRQVCTCNVNGVGYDELLCFRFVLVSCPSVLFCVSLTWMSVFRLFWVFVCLTWLVHAMWWSWLWWFTMFSMVCTCNVMICYVLMVIAWVFFFTRDIQPASTRNRTSVPSCPHCRPTTRRNDSMLLKSSHLKSRNLRYPSMDRLLDCILASIQGRLPHSKTFERCS